MRFADKWHQRVGRLDSYVSLGNFLWGLVPIGFGAVITWLSSANQAVSQYGAFGYAVVFLLASLMLALIFFLAGHGVAALRAKPSEPAQVDTPIGPLTVVRDAVYVNETVAIDGHHFIRCRFENVTFLYNGGHYTFDDCPVIYPAHFRTDNELVGRGFEIFGVVSLSRREVNVDGRGRRRSTLVFTADENNPNIMRLPSPAEKKP